MKQRTCRFAALGVFLFSLTMFGVGAYSRDVWTSDEHRYVEVARELDSSGDRGQVLRLNGDLYVTKPPGYFWAVTALERLPMLGLEKAALAVSAVAAAVAVTAVFWIGSILYGAGAGVWAAVVFATSVQVLTYSTRATLDTLLATLITLSLLFYVRHDCAKESTRGSWRLLASGFLAGLGVLVKGPIAIFVPGVVIVTYRLASRGGRPQDARPALLWLATALAPSALWLAGAIHEVGIGYARALVLDHAVGHPLGFVNKQEPPWFYLASLAGGLLPWTLLLPAAVRRFARRLKEGHRSDRFVAAWALAPFLLLCLLPAKRNVYLLPLYPGFALWIASQLSQDPKAEEREDRWLAYGRASFAVLAIGVGAAAAVFGGLAAARFDSVLEHILSSWLLLRQGLGPAVPWLALGLGGILVGAGVTALWTRSRRMDRAAVPPIAVTAAALVLLVVQPVESVGKAEQPFVRAVRPLVGEAVVAWYGRRDYSPNWVLERDVVPFFRTPEAVEEFVSAEQEPLFLLTERRSLERRGWPKGVEVVLGWPRALAPELILLRCADRMNDF